MSYITGLCRAYTDYIIQVPDDQTLVEMGVIKGEDTLVEFDKINHCLKKYKGQFIAGGPTANSLCIASGLGSKAAFIGKIANDDVGHFFKSSCDKSDVIFKTSMYEADNNGSGICIIFVSSDGQRSLWFNRGVVDDVNQADITQMAPILEQTNIFFAGLSLRNPLKIKFLKDIQRYTPNAKIVTSLQSFNELPNNECKFANENIVKNADIIIGNEEEYLKFLELNNESSFSAISEKFINKIFVKTMGENGSIIANGEHEYLIPAVDTKIIDTTGAGDAYAGGFLHAMNAGRNLQAAGEIGAYCASLVIAGIGARLEGKIELPKYLKEESK